MHLIIAVILKQIQAQEDKNAIQHHTVSPKPLAQAEGSRSGETGSLRRDRLAQARQARSGETGSLRRAPPSPRRGLEKPGHEHRGISLKRDPSRLGELPARSKAQWVAWATLRAET